LTRPANRLNIPIFIASLLLSLMLWLVVYSQNLPVQTPAYFSLPVRTTESGLDGGRLRITKIPELISLTAVGNADQLRAIKDANPYALVDLRGARPGQNRYPVAVMPEDVSKYFTEQPVFTTVTLEPMASKRMRVKVDTSGELNDNTLLLDKVNVLPAVVVIRGAASVVRQVSGVRAILDLSQVATSSADRQPLSVDLEALTSDNRRVPDIEIEPSAVTLDPVLSPAPVKKAVFVIPTFIGTPADGYVAAGFDIRPRQVSIVGPSLMLASLTKVRTAPISLARMRTNTTVDVGLDLPPGVTSDTSKVKATVLIQPALPAAPPPTPSDQ